MRRILVAALLALAFAAPAFAQQDRGAAELVGLFQQSCLAFSGQTAKLREWASAKKLPEMPARNAEALKGKEPGKVFNATKGDQHLAVVSFDNGGCQAILAYGDQRAVDDALKALFQKLNATAKTVSSKRSGNAREIVLRVTVEPRTSLVTITTTPNPKLPSAPPKITLATAAG